MKAYSMGDFSPMLRPHPSVISSVSARSRTRPPAGEAELLREQVDQLQRENQTLRSEITRLRLFQALDAPLENEQDESDPPLPADARKLYFVLPDVFSQIAYFKMAHDLGFGLERSQKIVGILLRQRFLLRSGEELSKSDPFQYRMALTR